MAVNINNATYGYDANNLSHTINQLHLKCVQETISKLNMGLMTVRESVDNAWKGQSAEKFKKTFEEQANEVSKAIEMVGERCSSDLTNFVNSLADVDNEINF